MDTMSIKRGVIRLFNPADWTATVQVLPSQGDYLTGVQVAKNLLAAEIMPGDHCAILFFDELNPDDAIIIAVYDVPSAEPVPPVTSIAGGVGGAALTGDIALVPGPSGNVSISESGQQIIIDSAGGGGSPPLVDTQTSTVTITDGANHFTNTLNFTLAASAAVLVVGTIHYKTTGQGLHIAFLLDGGQIGPQSPVAGNDMLVKQSGEAEQFTLAFYATIAAGAHTLQLRLSQAISIGTATVYWSQLAVK